MTDVIFIAACIVGLMSAWVAALEPGQLFQRLGRVFSDWKKAIEADENGYTDGHNWAELWSCPYCLGWWIGIVVGGSIGLLRQLVWAWFRPVGLADDRN